MTDTILDRIVEQKRFRIEQRQNEISLPDLRQKAESLAKLAPGSEQPANFAAALRQPKKPGPDR